MFSLSQRVRDSFRSSKRPAVRRALLLLAVLSSLLGCKAMKETKREMSEAMYEAGGLLRPSQGALSKTGREIERNTTRD